MPSYANAATIVPNPYKINTTTPVSPLPHKD
jgi:hypothetical protein